MKKLTIAGLALIGVLFASVGVFAYQGNMNKPTDEQQQAIQKAMDDGNYTAFHDLLTQNGRNPRIVQVVNESNFAEFVSAVNAAKAGNFSEAKAFMQKYDLGLGIIKHVAGFAYARGEAANHHGHAYAYGHLAEHHGHAYAYAKGHEKNGQD